MNELLWHVGAQLYFLPQYPLAIWELVEGNAVELVIWLVFGALATFGLSRFRQGRFVIPFIAAWFMPGSLVCGSAGIWPLPFAVSMIFGNGNCASVLSVSANFAVNCALLYGLRTISRKLRAQMRPSQPAS